MAKEEIVRESKADTWFRINVQDDREFILKVCDMTSRKITALTHIRLMNEKREYVSSVVYAVIVDKIFDVIGRYLQEQQKRHPMYNIVIGQNLNIGYTNDSNIENEKVGNFFPFIEYLTENRSVFPIVRSDPVETASLSYKSWLEKNVKKNVEEAKKISSQAMRELKDSGYNVFFEEAVIPILCIFIDMLVMAMKHEYDSLKDTGQDEISVNVMGLFYAHYSFDKEENREVIEFEPGIKMKQDYKNDTVAGPGY